jgi:adenine-specific DNA-methyltransferase
MPPALRAVVESVRARVVILSYNDESWATLDELADWCSSHGAVQTLAFDSKRYVGAQIGIYNPSGEKVGQVSRLRNLEYVVVAGPKDEVDAITGPYVGHGRTTAGQGSLFGNG